jgi:hypothetical protein
LTARLADPYNSVMCGGLSSRFEVSMLAIDNTHFHSEHDLFLRLFLTSGGGW